MDVSRLQLFLRFADCALVPTTLMLTAGALMPTTFVARARLPALLRLPVGRMLLMSRLLMLRLLRTLLLLM
jgi:hypothetical protein